MALDRMLFYVHTNVVSDVSAYKLERDDEKVVLRCIGGYSSPTGFQDGMEKAKYRLEQYWNSYPDWEQSSKRLGEREVKQQINLARDSLERAFAEFAMSMNNLDKAAGNEKLTALINANNRSIVQFSNQ